MPRHDWFDDDTMSRDSGRSEYGRSDYDRREHEDRDHGAMFSRDRNDRYRSERSHRDHDDDRGRGRGAIGGWGGLMGENTSRSRDQHQDRDDDRDHNRERQDRMSRRDERMGDREERFGSDDFNRGVPMDETQRLIASNKVEGTPVYDRNGDKLGSVHNFMVDKREGRVVYAVLKHGGGFLGLGERYYPLEWNQLTYDTRLGGYHTKMVEEDLESFGSFDSEGRYHSRSGSMRSRGERDMGRDRHRERGSRQPW